MCVCVCVCVCVVVCVCVCVCENEDTTPLAQMEAMNVVSSVQIFHKPYKSIEPDVPRQKCESRNVNTESRNVNTESRNVNTLM